MCPVVQPCGAAALDYSQLTRTISNMYEPIAGCGALKGKEKLFLIRKIQGLALGWMMWYKKR